MEETMVGTKVFSFKRGSVHPDWKCVCGRLNRGTVRYTRQGREVCQSCWLDREYVEDHNGNNS